MSDNGTSKLNTLLLTAVLGLCSWTLFTLSDVKDKTSVGAEKDRQFDVALAEIKAKQADLETKLYELNLRVTTHISVDNKRYERPTN